MEDTANDLRRRAARILPCLVAVAMLAPIAQAQREAFDVDDVSIAFDRPATWQLVEAPTAPAPFTITIADDERAAIGINVITLDAETAREIVELGAVATALEAWDGFADEVSGARVTAVAETSVAGRSAGRLAFANDAITGAVVVFVADEALVTIVATAPIARRDPLDAALDTVLAGLEVRGTLAATVENPLLRAGSRTPGVENPLLRGQAAATSASAASPALFVEPFTSQDAATVFGGRLDLGPSGAWIGALTGAAYELRNDSDPTAVRYYYVDDIEGFDRPPSAARVAVDVTVRPGGELAAAGLLFDFDPARGTYLAFGVSSSGITVLQRSDAGLELLAEQASDAVTAGAVNRLELRPSGTDVAVYVNDASVLTLQATNPFSGAVGIIAIGSGTFTFSELVIDARE
ncbi:MAG: hypothetical protein EA416_01540 [Trueperaceae bacterium]|nr:MAG: hypothetical protein EA416_01540 [Trueperaceae bacterium]